MVQENVHTVPNSRAISVTLKHANGSSVPITIQPGNAKIDDEGYVRFFVWDWDDNDPQPYKLHPYSGPMADRIAWTLDFLAGYGLSRLGSKLVKTRPGMSSFEETSINVGRYFTFSNPGGQTIRSFISSHFLPHQLGYHSVVNDKLIFPQAIKVSIY